MKRFLPFLFAAIAAMQAAAAAEPSSAEKPAVLPTVNAEMLRALEAAPLKMQFHGTTPAELAAWQAEFRAKLDSLIGPHTPPKSWKVSVLPTRDFSDHTREELLLEADGTPGLPLYVLRPRGDGPFPVVLCLHGHGEFGHDPVAGVDDTPELK